MKLLLILTIVACVNISCAKPRVSSAARETPAREFDGKNGLTEAQAVELAEKFIARNGYTDLPPDKENLSLESIEWESDVDEMLKGRYNTLERKAFGVSKGRKGGAKGWTVVFRFKDRSDEQTRKNGRAVTMNLDGSKARVEHVDFILAKVEKEL